MSYPVDSTVDLMSDLRLLVYKHIFFCAGLVYSNEINRGRFN